ncbi:MAG: hypothetical protein AAFV53_02335 [Myxococcota bacterium]
MVPFLTWFSVAFGQAPPPSVALPEDPSVLIPLADLTAVSGCWIFQMTATTLADFGVFGKSKEVTVARGVLSEGDWKSIVQIDPAPGTSDPSINFEMDAGSVPFFPPLVGRLPSMEGEMAGIFEEFVNEFRAGGEIDMLSGEMVDGERMLRLDRSQPIQVDNGRERKVNTTAMFKTDPLQMVSWTASLNKGMKLDAGKVRRGEATVTFKDALPVQETLAVRFRYLVFFGGLDQTLHYELLGPCLTR